MVKHKFKEAMESHGLSKGSVIFIPLQTSDKYLVEYVHFCVRLDH